MPLIVLSATAEGYPNYVNFSFCGSIEPNNEEGYYLTFCDFSSGSIRLIFDQNGIHRMLD